jgi:hypothetical protein
VLWPEPQNPDYPVCIATIQEERLMPTPQEQQSNAGISPIVVFVVIATIIVLLTFLIAFIVIRKNVC